MRNIKLLLVDDEVEFVEALAERLRMRDIRGDTVFDGMEALDFVGHDEPDVMVLDLKMPGINGMEVLRRVKARYLKMQVIILTGHGSDQDELQARDLGVFDYLKKPVDLDILVERIRAAAREIRGTECCTATVLSQRGSQDGVKDVLYQ